MDKQENGKWSRKSTTITSD